MGASLVPRKSLTLPDSFSCYLTLLSCYFNCELTSKSLVEGKVPTKPGGCNRSHIPKALEHPTGQPNLQPSHEPPAPSSLQAPVTLKPDGIGGKKKKKIK